MKHFLTVFLSFSLGILLIAGLILILHPASAVAADDQTQVIASAIAFIKSQQQPSGGINGLSGTADPDTTARSILALVAANQTVSEVVSLQGNSMLDYLASTESISFTNDMTGTLFPGRAGEILAAISVAGENPKTFIGHNLLSQLEQSFHADTGVYSTTARQGYSSGEASDLNQAWAILGLSLAGQTVPDAATEYLKRGQAEDGSWGMGDPDTTALAMTALLASGKITAQDGTIQRAIEYFHSTQTPSGGWKPSWDTDSLNADSTGWIIQALVSAGEDLRGQSWTKEGHNPVDALLGLQKPDGSIGGTYANAYSTAEAIIGLAGIPLFDLVKAPIPHRAGLVIFSGDNSVITDCISFTQNSITGLDLLQRSALTIETATNPTQGTAVCKIGNVGDTSNNCFGSMPDYWAYWVFGENGWEYSPVGASQSQVVDGGVYAWSWGTGSPPPVLSFRNVCEGVAYALPTATVIALAATDTALPSPEATLVSISATPQPTSTPPPAANHTSSYIVYAAILLTLGILVIYLIRSRKV